jgi:hypothetical protein
MGIEGMANINLPFEGEVTADNTEAFEVRNKGNKGTGLAGKSKNWMGVYGESDEYQGVHGTSTKNAGVVGQSLGEGYGVYGVSEKGLGVYGESKEGHAVYGESKGAQSTGVVGVSNGAQGIGLAGKSKNWMGVYGESDEYQGVHGTSTKNAGVVGQSLGEGYGVYGVSEKGLGVYGLSKNGTGVYGEGAKAGVFRGDVEVTGDIKLLNADCAEDFDIAEENVEPGTVMVLNENGSLKPSYQEYDKKVAGIVSGAGGYKPAIVLDKQSENENQNHNIKGRLPIALMGKVYCNVDARSSSIQIGDLLTTSSTKGCAMKAEDPIKAFGTVIGKALDSIKHGVGMIPVLVSLQ